MNTKIALFIAGTVLLLVVLTMGEGGTVSQIADRGPAEDTEQGAAAPAPASTPAPAPQQASGSWYASSAPVQQPEMPIYHQNETRVAPAPMVVDPKVAAASEIQ